MTPRNRGLLYALSTEDNEVPPNTTPAFDPDDQAPMDIVVDHDHPETIEALSLVEYADLCRQAEGPMEEALEGEQLTTESFSERWQNFKNRFETRMSNEDAYVDTMEKRLKEKLPTIQAATDKPASNVPISIFANANWYQLNDVRVINNAQQIIQNLERLIELNSIVEQEWVPTYAKAIKGMMDILATGASDVDTAYSKAYVFDATFPAPKLGKLAKNPKPIKLSGGKTIAGHITDSFPGGWAVVYYEVVDTHEKGVKRGNDFYVDQTVSKTITKVQLKPATREEMKKITELSIKLCEIMNKYIDVSIDAGAKMLLDKMNNFENTHRNWRKYPEAERKKLSAILNTANSILMRSWVTADMCDGTRMALRAFERFVDMSLQRLK